ncbi:MAG: hypothetical protein ACJA0M_000341 [Chitinophagales bacterium]|jgi:hypothetical protein
MGDMALSQNTFILASGQQYFRLGPYCLASMGKYVDNRCAGFRFPYIALYVDLKEAS